ncbi:MAG TPA: phosphoribosylglycinamide synthetase C domain-containing protein, partial [Geminicoccaceae bacterium]|nr:phosphoribosylglycinamide synthetase C domain-containing protein [Geminicoccaceae bacterium]
LPRLMTDLGQLIVGAVDGVLGHMDLRWYPEHAMCVVMASRGYPGAHETGGEVRGIDAAEEDASVTVFHAGTELRDGRIVAVGGRVLGVTGRGATLAEARDRTYAAVDKIDWPGGFCRRDIGWRALGRR